MIRLLLAVSVVVGGFVVNSTGASAMPDPTSAEAQFLELLNSVRTSKGLVPLARDTSVDPLARSWSEHMANVFDRNGNLVIDSAAPTDCERSALCHRPGLGTAIAALEPAWQRAGENIGTGGTVQGLHDAFVASPGHYANIVGDYNRVGVGVIIRGSRIWITFDFLLGPALPAGTTSSPAPATTAAATSGSAQRVTGPPIASVQAGAAGRVVPVVPRRVLDTRDGTGGTLGRVAAGATVAVDLSAGADRPAGAVAAMLNVTATDTAGAGYLTVYPCGSTVPLASSLNYRAGATVPNSVAVPLGTNGQVCIYTQTATNVVADLTAWFTSTSTGAGLVTPDAPVRLLDSRDTGGANDTFVVPVGSQVPANATAVAVNVTVTEPIAAGYLTVFPCGSDAPLASNLNYVAGQTTPNLGTVKIGAERSICLRSKVRTHVVVDLMGWFSPEGTPIFPVAPTRFLDTREGIGGWRGWLDGTNAIDLAVAGVAGVPTSATGVVLNVTVTEATGAGYLTVYPCGTTRPSTSNLNYTAGLTVANLVDVHLGSGKVCVYASSPVHVVADVAGFTKP